MCQLGDTYCGKTAQSVTLLEPEGWKGRSMRVLSLCVAGRDRQEEKGRGE